MTPIVAELTTGGERIVLIAGGSAIDEIAEAARRLKLLTPLFSKSDPPGALVAPATWAAVVQLRAMFGDAFAPGPALQAWIAAEAARRTEPLAGALGYTPPEGLTPRPYQVAGALEIARTGRCLIFDEPRCLYGDAEMAINRNGKGFRIKLRDLVARFNGTGAYAGPRWDLSRPTYVQREVEGVVRLGRIVNAWASGVRVTYTVTTDTGRSIRASAEHPFLTERGWVELGDLAVGDQVNVRGPRATGGRRNGPHYRQVAGLRSHPHHRRHAAEGKGRQVLHKITTERVASIELYGEEETYDIEVADDPHNFLADGFVVHNTGKTITTILGLLERLDPHSSPTDPPGSFAGDPILVICPASVVDPWVEEWGRWAPHLRTVAWRGSKRKALAGTADVYVTSYETARIDTPPARTPVRGTPLKGLEARTLVVDETHLAKNPRAERTKAVQRLSKDVHTFVGLSGTPITHHPGDLWASLTCLAPGAWPSRERWVHRYCEVLPGDYDEQILGLHPAVEPEFRLTILGQHRRVARADVMSQLPPKTYSVRTVEIPKVWRKAYDDMESQMLAELPDGEELSVMSVLAQMTRLSQLASAAAEIETTVEVDEDGREKPHVTVALKEPSWKVDALLEVLEERSDEQVVVFAPSRQLIMLAGRACEKAGYEVGYIVGGQSQTERSRVRQGFQSGAINIVCATTGAGGTGITLSAAGTLVFLQRPWSLVESVQAEDRGEGDYGATRGTEVIDIVARNTIDTRVRAVLRERAGQLSELVGDPRIVTELLGGTNCTRHKESA